MKAKIKSLAWSCLALSCGAASAQIRDGAYTGTLECGPLITNPQQGAWKQPINIEVPFEFRLPAGRTYAAMDC